MNTHGSNFDLSGLSTESQQLVQDMVTSLKRRKIAGAYACARATTALYHKILSDWMWASTEVAMALIRCVARTLQHAQPAELSIGNIARRVLHITREAYVFAIKKAASEHVSLQASLAMEQGPSLVNLHSTADQEDFSEPFDLRDAVLQEISSLREELAVVYKDIVKEAHNHIQPDDVIFTYGHSSSVESVLCDVVKTRPFKVLVAEAHPGGNGRLMAANLTRAGIPTTVVPDSNIFAIMPRVTKVIVGVHAVLANGVLLAHAGMNMAAKAARHHSVPFIVCTGMYKLSPIFPYPKDVDSYSNLQSPAAVLPLRLLGNHSQTAANPTNVPNPAYDYVPAEDVSLFLMEQAHDPSFLYRLLAEYYHPEDYEL